MLSRLARAVTARFHAARGGPPESGVETYSQEGEDMVLRRLFGDQGEGFYVDIGAHHPVRFSNTYYFYRQGWRGLNVDAAPGSMTAFRKLRPRDINIEIAVGRQAGTDTLTIFNEPALNTLSPELAETRRELHGYDVVSSVPVLVTTLSQLLDEYLEPQQGIDLLSVDVEGLDEAVVLSNDWDRYRPRVVLVETPETTVVELPGRSIASFLAARGYVAWAKLYNTAIFVREDFRLP